MKLYQALAYPRFEQPRQVPEEEELESEIDHVEESVHALKERQESAIQTEKLAESFQEARRRRKEQQEKKNAAAVAAAAGASAAAKKHPVQLPAAERPRTENKPIECLPESEAKIAEVPPEEVLEAERTPEAAPKGEIEILAPAEHAPAEAEIPSVISPQPVKVATQEEVQRDVLAAEAEVSQVENQQQEETDKEIKEEMQQLLEEHEHAHAAAAAASAEQEAAAEKAATSALEAEREVQEATSTTGAQQSSAGSHTEGQEAAAATNTERAATAAPKHGTTNKSGAAEGADVAATPVEADDENETEEEEEGDTTEQDERDSIRNAKENEANHQRHADKNKPKGDAAKSRERENAERTVGGAVQQGRKPPV
ncbi:uncharacterized protein EMH_0009350 [Eimeria mitis]|uniref:Uncharacterized protein n=1 Tax=Eimeria mitis TaxID=44415 RepID=U6JPP4_9EIME|nr:uncharacterized protein EMH_0009350 [Eimeria mitis]CDJ27429.1 hypothetical protein, conserved [Eimeria mitis]